MQFQNRSTIGIFIRAIANCYGHVALRLWCLNCEKYFLVNLLTIWNVIKFVGSSANVLLLQLQIILRDPKIHLQSNLTFWGLWDSDQYHNGVDSWEISSVLDELWVGLAYLAYLNVKSASRPSFEISASFRTCPNLELNRQHHRQALDRARA